MIAIIVLLSIVTFYYAGAILFLYRGLKNLGCPNDPAVAQQRLTFSIVIAARNEEETIGRCLTGVLSQSLPPDRYEVIVVNDCSSDRTGEICAEVAAQHPALRVIAIEQTPPGVAPKKHAVAAGVREAANEIVVLTDADCVVPPGWLAAIERTFAGDTGMVQGITAYEQPNGMNRFFWGLQAIDFLSHGIVAAAAIGAQMPLNSNANNFAFRKKAFEAAQGYGTVSQRVISGDDDLLLQRIAGSGTWNVRFMTDPAGKVVTRPTATVRGVFEQRKRWGSKTVYYPLRQVVFLSGIFVFYLTLAATLIAGIFLPVFWAAFAVMLGVKIAGEYLLLIRGTALFDEKKLRPFILPASLMQLPLVLAAVVLGVFGKFSWKGERYRRKVDSD